MKSKLRFVFSLSAMRGTVVVLLTFSGCSERVLPDVTMIGDGREMPATDIGIPVAGLTNTNLSFYAIVSGPRFPLSLETRQEIARVLVSLKYDSVITKDKLAMTAIVSQENSPPHQQCVFFEGGFVSVNKDIYQAGNELMKIVGVLKKEEKLHDRRQREKGTSQRD
jgi:hypothetical protein